MEKKSKAMAALACAALLVLIGSGCVRCTMVHSTQQDPAEQNQEEGAADEADAAKNSLEKLLGTKWTSKDGKATLSIMNGAFVERAAGEEKVTYWEPENDPIVKAFGTPDVAELTHDPNFNWWDNYPAMPEPYDTWSDGISYGPEGFKPAHNKGLGAKEGRNYK